jgi:hypothetical protein
MAEESQLTLLQKSSAEILRAQTARPQDDNPFTGVSCECIAVARNDD